MDSLNDADYTCPPLAPLDWIYAGPGWSTIQPKWERWTTQERKPVYGHAIVCVECAEVVQVRAIVCGECS